MAGKDTAVVLKGKARLLDIVQRHESSIVEVMDRPLPMTRIVRDIENAIRENFKIAGCTSLSVLNSVVRAYRDGLSIAPQQAYLVPYGPICQLVYDYRGLIQIARQNGVLEYMVPFLGREGEEYSVSENGRLSHQPGPPSNPDDLIDGVTFAYCRTRLTSGTIMPEVLVWRAELDKVRKMATAKKKRDDGPWDIWTEEMFRKTAVRRTMKFVPQHPRVVEAREMDTITDSDQFHPQPPILEVDVESDEPLDPNAEPPEDGDEDPQRKR
jgi:phage RecT family recombinase